MKEKILALLKTRFKSLGFGAQTLDGVAAYLAQTVTEEDKVEEAVTGAEPLLKAFQADADRRATAAAENARKEKEKGADPKEEEPKPGDDTPAWAKGLMKKIDEHAAEIASLKTGKTTDSRKARLEKELEKAPEAFKKTVLRSFEHMNFTEDSAFETFLEETRTEAAEFEQNLSNTKLSGHHVPAGGGPTGKAAEASVKSFLDAKLAPQKSA